jgi:lycopene cyclase domain-containing protein
MMTYLLLDFLFVGIVLLCDVAIFKTNVWRIRSTWLLFGVIFGLTLIFDTLLTSLPVVTYDYTKLLGLYIGSIPIEDLAYSLVVAIAVPMLRKVIHE